MERQEKRAMDEHIDSLTFTLFQRPSFLEGMARVVDYEGVLNMYNTSVTSQEADAESIAADWRMVGNDIQKAMTHEQ
jgi:hypothetical protein